MTTSTTTTTKTKQKNIKRRSLKAKRNRGYVRILRDFVILDRYAYLRLKHERRERKRQTNGQKMSEPVIRENKENKRENKLKVATKT